MKLARLQMGVSQETLAAMIGSTRNTVATWEKGATAIPSDQLAMVAAESGANPAWLLTGDGEMDG